MRILGIDPGINITGYGLIDTLDNDRFALIEAGVIRTSPKQLLPGRLARIYHELTKLINEYSPRALVLEKTFSHYKYPATVITISYARAMACLVCAEKNIFLYEYSATRIKKVLTGKGHASKEQVQKMIFHLLDTGGAEVYTDATDALALAVGHSRLKKADFLKSLT